MLSAEVWAHTRRPYMLISLLLAAVLQTNATPSAGEIGAFYFEAMNESQVWVDLSPQTVEEGPAPVLLNVTIRFKGRRSDVPPAVADIRAASVNTAFPLRVRQGILRFTTTDGREYDLTAPGRLSRFTSSCDKCSLDTLTTRLAFDELQEIARSPQVTMNALGFEMRLTPGDLKLLAALIDAVREGVVIK
jgi:hypothetical protein